MSVEILVTNVSSLFDKAGPDLCKRTNSAVGVHLRNAYGHVRERLAISLRVSYNIVHRHSFSVACKVRARAHVWTRHYR